MAGKYSGPYAPKYGPFSGYSFRSYRQYLNAKAILRGYESESQRHRIEGKSRKRSSETGQLPTEHQPAPILPQPELTRFDRYYSTILQHHRSTYDSPEHAFMSGEAEHFRSLIAARDALTGEDADQMDKRAWSFLYSGEERTDFEWGHTPGKE